MTNKKLTVRKGTKAELAAAVAKVKPPGKRTEKAKRKGTPGGGYE